MAGDWIKWTKGLPAKPEVIRMAATLRATREAVVCALMRFWEWCDENIADHDVRENGSAFVKLSPSAGDNAAVVDALVGTPGFADSLAVVGWIKFRDDLIELPNFGRHNGETAKTRARNAKNQQRKRQAGGTDPPPSPKRPVAEASPKASPRHGDNSVTRGEERREEEKSPPNPPLAGGAEAVSPPASEPPKPRHRSPPDPQLLAAIADVTGSDPATTSRSLGSLASSLAAADPPYTPADVREFGRRFASICTWAARDNRTRPTFNEVRKYIGHIRAAPARPARRRRPEPADAAGRAPPLDA